MTLEASAAVQAISAVAIVALTVVLAIIAAKALNASSKQAESAAKAIDAAHEQARIAAATVAEMQKDRHLTSVPMLGITLNPLDTTQVNRVLSVVYLTNASDYAAINVHVSLGEAWDPCKPQELRIAVPSPLPIIAPHERVNLPVDLSRFPRAEAPRVFHTDWVVITVVYEGLLGAKVKQEWYWEPYEWEGGNEPVPGHGEKLLLCSMAGTSGADPNVNDIEWRREP